MKVLYLSDRDEDMTKMMHLQTRYETVVPTIYSNDFEILTQMKIFLNADSFRILPLATQFKATPPAKHKFFNP